MVKAKTRQILEECIETGVEFGYNRAHKYGDTPKPQQIFEEIENAIWLEIDARFDFELEHIRDLLHELVEGFDHLKTERNERNERNKCNQHPDAPHGMDRSASLNLNRYVCECESWEPEDDA